MISKDPEATRIEMLAILAMGICSKNHETAVDALICLASLRKHPDFIPEMSRSENWRSVDLAACLAATVGDDYLDSIINSLEPTSLMQDVRPIDAMACAMQQAAPLFGVAHVEIGENVLCDACGKDFTSSEAKGGLLCQSKAICPDCKPEWMRLTVEYHEEHYIRCHCPENMGFADWVRSVVRNPELVAVAEEMHRANQAAPAPSEQEAQ